MQGNLLLAATFPRWVAYDKVVVLRQREFVMEKITVNDNCRFGFQPFFTTPQQGRKKRIRTHFLFELVQINWLQFLKQGKIDTESSDTAGVEIRSEERRGGK